MAMEKIFRDVKKEITPDMGVIIEVDKIVEKINVTMESMGIIAECVKGGSIAKGTFLKDDYDIDLFMRFNTQYKEQNISNITEDILKKLCDRIKIKSLERIH